MYVYPDTGDRIDMLDPFHGISGQYLGITPWPFEAIEGTGY